MNELQILLQNEITKEIQCKEISKRKFDEWITSCKANDKQAEITKRIKNKVGNPVYQVLNQFLNTDIIDLCCNYLTTKFCLDCKIMFPRKLQNFKRVSICLGCMNSFRLRDDCELEKWIWIKLKYDQHDVFDLSVSFKNKNSLLFQYLHKILLSNFNSDSNLKLDYYNEVIKDEDYFFLGFAKTYNSDYKVVFTTKSERSDANFVRTLRKEI